MLARMPVISRQYIHPFGTRARPVHGKNHYRQGAPPQRAGPTSGANAHGKRAKKGNGGLGGTSGLAVAVHLMCAVLGVHGVLVVKAVPVPVRRASP